MSDLIDRQAAIDAIKTWGLLDGLSEGQAIEILADEEKLPSAQPEILACGEGELNAPDTNVGDMISRQAAIEALRECQTYLFDEHDPDKKIELRSAEMAIEELPAAQPDHTADFSKKASISCAHENDLVSRKSAIEAINGMIDRFERILADIRESKGDDSVCGMCEYDGAYMGQSGDWCNECPGFDKDDCFKLSDKCRKRWIGDIVLPSVAPTIAQTNESTAPSTAPSTDDWIPVERELPDDLAEVNVTWVNHEPEPYYEFIKSKPFTASAVYYKGKWYWYSSTCADLLGEYGRNDVDKVDDAIEITAWRPLPEPYRGGGEE